MVCDLDNDAKQLLCDETMHRMIYWRHGAVFDSFADSSDLPVPQMAKSADLYKCRNMPIKDTGMKLPMYWCKARRYNKTWSVSDLGPKADFESSSDSNSDSNADSSSESVDESPVQSVVYGFFLTGSRYEKRRVYVFGPPFSDEKTPSNVRIRLQLDRLRPRT